MRIARPAKMQKDFRAIEDVWEPKKKATALVKEVMVIEGPAWLMATFIRSFTGLLMSVWSMALHTTNMSSTPMPSSKKGNSECTLENFCPNANPINWHDMYDRMIHMRPAPAAQVRKWTGEQPPSTKIVYTETR